MRYSHCWVITPEMLSSVAGSGGPRVPDYGLPWYVGQYVSVRAVIKDMWGGTDTDPYTHACRIEIEGVTVDVGLAHSWTLTPENGVLSELETRILNGQPVTITGRRVHDTVGIGIDTTAERLTWQSVAGLIVGAAGLLVLASVAGHWLVSRFSA